MILSATIDISTNPPRSSFMTPSTLLLCNRKWVIYRTSAVSTKKK